MFGIELTHTFDWKMGCHIVQYRKLGRTGLDVGVIGLGTEFLWRA